MQIHELNTYVGKPGEMDFFAIDSGFDTAKLSAKSILLQPVDENNDPIYGDNGQLLRTNGDGSTSWVDEGLPTDEQTAQAVTNWLNDHPEATTTVADGSLTYAKLVRGTLGYVIPEMFGAVGDSTTDDTIAVQSAINYCGANGLPLLLIKTYGVTALKLNYNNLMICGSGEMTGFSALDNSAMFTTDNSSCADFTFRDFKMSGNGLGGKGFYSVGSHRLSSYLIDNLTINDFDIALDIESWVSNITNCWIIGNRIGLQLHGCNAVRIEGCSIFGFETNTDGIGIKSTSYNTAISIVNNTLQHLGGAILLYSGSSYTISGNYFEYNESDTYPVILVDGSTSRDLKCVIIEGNYIAPTGNETIAQLAIICKYVFNLFIGVNRFSAYYAICVDIDSDCEGAHLIDPLTNKLTNASKRVSAVITAYVEGIPSNPANSYFTMAYDRYRDRPIWWAGSKWIYADGSTRT